VVDGGSLVVVLSLFQSCLLIACWLVVDYLLLVWWFLGLVAWFFRECLVAVCCFFGDFSVVV